MKQKTVYVVSCLSRNYYDCENKFSIIGVYPSKKTAHRAMARNARSLFESDYMDEDYILDILPDCANISGRGRVWVVHYSICKRVMKFCMK